MVFSWKRCETCVHNNICIRKEEYETLTKKIQNVDKKKPYEEIRVTIECGHHKNNGKPDQFQFAVRV